MTSYTNEMMNALIDECLNDEEAKDICRCWHYNQQSIQVLDKDEIKEQFTYFKNIGTMKIEDYNNKMIKRNGRKFYVLVVQHTDEERCCFNCPMSLLGYGFWVSGFPYWFDKKKDRNDAIKIFNGE